MNRYQRKLRPGTPEAKAAKCVCTGETAVITNTITGETEETYLYDIECPLHGLEQSEVPSNW